MMAEGKRGAPLNNKNSARGRMLTDVCIEFARDNPGRMAEMVLVMHQIASGQHEATVRDRITAIAFLIERAYGKAHQSVHMTGDMTLRSAEELSDAELAAIAVGSSHRAIEAAEGEGDPTGIH